MAIGCTFWACDTTDAPPEYDPSKEVNPNAAVPVDYTLGRTMNALLGRGINLGNSWDSDGDDDNGWGYPIRDSDFATIKAAGFNSVRIPVRWQNGSDYTSHTVDPKRLNGVLEDIRFAIANGLTVVVNFHHYYQLNCSGGGYSEHGCTYDAAKYEAEKTHFLGMWAQVATAMGEFLDNQVVLEILNEPVIPNAERVDQLMNEAYNVIRTYAPGKTIMFESYHAAKFGDLGMLHLPKDGNIIFSGHYYEPYSYSHQGLGYDCNGDAVKANTAARDMLEYVNLAKSLYPDIDGVNHVPMNMGEFGIAGGAGSNCPSNKAVSDANKAEWAQKTAKAALNNGISFHYWSFGPTDGFEAFNIYSETWYSGFPQALIF